MDAVVGEKRKGEDNGAEPERKRTKMVDEYKGGVTETSVTEEEVDEFFAILRRIHVATQYFQKGEGAGGKLTGKRSLEYFDEEENGGSDDEKEEEEKKDDNAVEGCPSLDLNSDPVCAISDSPKGTSPSLHQKQRVASGSSVCP